MDHPLRVIVYDRTCTGRAALPGLTHSWIAGAWLYGRLGRVDAAFGVASWAEAFAHLARIAPGRRIGEVQYWGHGKWGSARVGREVLDARALSRGAAHRAGLDTLRARLAEDALVWFRTCETAGAHSGQRFVRDLAEHLGARVAGHTYIIGPWQSGLHCLRPGQAPAWDPAEGLREGTPAAPRRARWSRPGAPRTITCLTGELPAESGRD